MQGKHGKKFFQRNARGDRRVITGEEPFSEGNEIIISIDYEAQKLAYELMQGNKGSIVVIDLKDFSIPVAVSTPSISANDLRGISSSQYQELLNDPSRPLFNRAFMGLYPPGSSIKPLFATFALAILIQLGTRQYLMMDSLDLKKSKEFLMHGKKVAMDIQI